MTPRDITVAAVQSQLHWEDAAANRYMFGNKLRELGEPVDLVVLPEMFTTGFSMDAARLAEPENGPTLAWMQKHASLMQATITGSFIVEDNGRYFNRLLWVRPDGSYERYDKRHLFRMAGEDRHFAAGTQRLVVDFHGWGICPLVCYDLRFPAWSRNRWRQEGDFLAAEYDVLIYVANWPELRSHAWKTLLMARAMENISYVIGLNRVGNDAANNYYSGDSAIISYRGEPEKTAIIGREEIIVSKLSWQSLAEFRRRFPAGMDADEIQIL